MDSRLGFFLKQETAPEEDRDMTNRRLSLLAATFAAALLSAGFATANTPTIRLFPTTVVEDLRQTGNVARDMETGLQEVISQIAEVRNAMDAAGHPANFAPRHSARQLW